MKNKLNIRSFVPGIATTLFIYTLTFTALAATNMIGIKPVRIMVNGEMFVPKDVNGKEVPVLAYGDINYALLRAPEVAYGLEVGCDAEKKIATVGEVPVAPAPETPDDPAYTNWWSKENEANYQKFAAMWEITHMSSEDSFYPNPSKKYIVRQHEV